MCLESCLNVQEILISLTSKSELKLKRFSLRQEVASYMFCTSLANFLDSFSGLEHLSDLLDRTCISVAVTSFTATHGPNLTTLVWETRRDERDSLALCTSLPLNNRRREPTYLREICRQCPKLRELGFALDWTSKGKRNSLSRYAPDRPSDMMWLIKQQALGFIREFTDLRHSICVLYPATLRIPVSLSFMNYSIRQWLLT